MKPLQGKHVLLGVSGGIAVYKCPDLVRRLREAGAEVQVVMTASAEQFVTPLTFQVVSRRTVRTSLWDTAAEAAMSHIELARWADLVLVAPATANFMAKLAHGFGDDLLSTLCLATEAPIFLAPAMNRVMWGNPATADNLKRLAKRGLKVLGPAAGELAEGEVGQGRMLEPADIVAALADSGATRASLAGRLVLVTAGPTREAIDPVRFVSNHSSGRMGFELAAAARRAGADVILVTGPVDLATPEGVERIDVETAAEMHEAVILRAREAGIFIAAAAVADYRPASPAVQKLKKHEAGMKLEMIRNPDILAAVAALPDGPFTVGFAAETEEIEANARKKLAAKGVDMIAANLVGPGVGFHTEDNAIAVFWQGGGKSLGEGPKRRLAESLVALIAERIAASAK